ncbi:fibroblast growth factor-binding protein 1-like [Scleropages formosus]|nr:fibroblast growth factor-binding protein 1-like [Scleropages formosus]
MSMLKNVALFLLLSCIAQHVLAAQSERGAGRKGGRAKAEGRGKGGANRDAPPEKPPGEKPPGEKSPGASPRADKAQKSRGANEVFKGKFSTNDKTQCTWAASGKVAITLGVTCRNGGLEFACEYTAKPSVCPQYAANSKAYWKQISRALKKQKKLCQDANALIKSGVCKRAKKDAHFRLNQGTSTSAPPPGPTTSAQGGKSCKDSVDHKKMAEEQCGSSWSSLCTFLFSMIQSDDC